MKITILKPKENTPREIELHMSSACWDLLSAKGQLNCSPTKMCDQLKEYVELPARTMEFIYGFRDENETILGFMLFCCQKEDVKLVFLETFGKWLSEKIRVGWSSEEAIGVYEITIE